MKYTDRVMNIAKDALSKMEQIAGQIENLNRRFKAEEISGVDYQAQKVELEKQRNTVQLEAIQQLQDAGKAYREAVEKGAEIDGTMLHDDAKLLQLDMKMTTHQFEALVEKHKDNPLMTQLLQEYSDKHKGLYAGFIPAPESRISAFDAFISAAHDAIRTPDTMRGAMFLEGYYTPAHCAEIE